MFYTVCLYILIDTYLIDTYLLIDRYNLYNESTITFFCSLPRCHSSFANSRIEKYAFFYIYIDRKFYIYMYRKSIYI